MKLFSHSRASLLSSRFPLPVLPLIAALVCVLSFSPAAVHCAPSSTRVPTNELLSALSSLPPHFSYFGSIFQNAGELQLQHQQHQQHHWLQGASSLRGLRL